MKRIVPPPIYRLQLHREYDIDEAQLNEWYTLEERKLVGFFKKRWEWQRVSFGYLQWAKRISKEFGIDLPMW